MGTRFPPQSASRRERDGEPGDAAVTDAEATAGDADGAEGFPTDGAGGSDGEDGATSQGRGSLLVGLLKLARPKQWAKNLLVFAAPAADGALTDSTHLGQALVAFVCFCMAAAGTYYINDARDVEADRLHPSKRFRPVAAGEVPVSLAFVAGGVLLVTAVLLSLTVDPDLTLIVAGYVGLTTAYSAVLKHIAVVDLVAIASGFVLRAVAGAAATGVPVSNWFFIITIFGSLFVVAGKRGAEAKEMGDEAADFRSVLATYTPNYTAYLRTVTSSAMLVSYCMWAVEKAEDLGLSTREHPWYQMSIVPFVMGVLRYALVLDQGKGSAPEEIILKDRYLQLIGLLWAVVVGIGVYAQP